MVGTIQWGRANPLTQTSILLGRTTYSNIMDNSFPTTTTLPVLPSREKGVKLTEKEICLVKWEEWALSAEEHFHAQDLWQRKPNGLPMGHR